MLHSALSLELLPPVFQFHLITTTHHDQHWIREICHAKKLPLLFFCSPWRIHFSSSKPSKVNLHFYWVCVFLCQICLSCNESRGGWGGNKRQRIQTLLCDPVSRGIIVLSIRPSLICHCMYTIHQRR